MERFLSVILAELKLKKMYKLSKTSKKRLDTCHRDLQTIIKEALRVSDIDFGVAEGHRSIEKQKEYFDKGLSKIDGYKKLGKHNYKPSYAVDIYPFVEGKARWSNEDLSYIAGIIRAVSQRLLEDGQISHEIRWGGNWDMDGNILLDQSFDDRPHFELIKIK